MTEETTKMNIMQFHQLLRVLESIKTSLDTIGRELSEIKQRMR